MTNVSIGVIARRAAVKRAQDEAKAEIETYRRNLEEDFKKKQDEVCTPIIKPALPIPGLYCSLGLRVGPLVACCFNWSILASKLVQSAPSSMCRMLLSEEHVYTPELSR